MLLELQIIQCQLLHPLKVKQRIVMIQLSMKCNDIGP
jgi:hypothetical protein